MAVEVLEGIAVGVAVGLAVGVVVGFEVGVAVGFEIGITVGFEVGIAAGQHNAATLHLQNFGGQVLITQVIPVRSSLLKSPRRSCPHNSNHPGGQVLITQITPAVRPS